MEGISAITGAGRSTEVTMVTMQGGRSDSGGTVDIASLQNNLVKPRYCCSWFISIMLWIFVIMTLTAIIYCFIWMELIFILYFIPPLVCVLLWCMFNCVNFRHSRLSKYFDNQMDANGLTNYIKYLQEYNVPTIEWRVDCYHYETRTRDVTRTDADGKEYTVTETYEEKVTTHTAKMYYQFITCIDGTNEFPYNNNNNSNNDDLESGHKAEIKSMKPVPLFVTVTFKKNFLFLDDETRQDYNNKKSQFKQDNDKDIHQSCSTIMNIPKWRDSLMLPNTQNSDSDLKDLNYMTKQKFELFSTLGCSPCYRDWFYARVQPKLLTVIKKISIH